MESKEFVREIEYQDIADDRCYLPHTLAQSALFALARDPGCSFDEASRLIRCGAGTEISFTNLKGDNVTLYAPRLLYCTPDMGTFLATIAAAQQAGISEYRLSSKTTPIYFSKFPVGALYEILAITSKKSNRLWYSLDAVGATRINVEYADPVKHGNQPKWSSRSFWETEYFPRKGRSGGHIEMMLAPCLVPQRHYLWANAVEINSLKSDTARAIYWALLSREHWGLTVDEWQKALRSVDQNQWRWRDEYLIPGLRELENLGFVWEKRETRDGIKYIVKRPKE